MPFSDWRARLNWFFEGPRHWAAISPIFKRHAAYARRYIPDVISEHDDMYSRLEAGAMDHYMHVGRSAIQVITTALVAAEKNDVASILDLPCGGGRVTRHLCAFFPEAEIFVSDLNKDKEKFVVETFGAKPIKSDPDLTGEPERKFDLIFVGSLVTYFDEVRFRRALSWFTRALAPGGILVLTTHGRRHEHTQVNVRQYIDAPLWRPASEGFTGEGFGYAPYPGQDYGLSVNKPSWLIRLTEDNPDVRIVGFHEAAWDDHQDVLVLQNKSLFA